MSALAQLEVMCTSIWSTWRAHMPLSFYGGMQWFAIGEMAERFKAPVLKTVVGSVAEWSIAPVLKTGNGQPFVSSNLTASAN